MPESPRAVKGRPPATEEAGPPFSARGIVSATSTLQRAAAVLAVLLVAASALLLAVPDDTAQSPPSPVPRDSVVNRAHNLPASPEADRRDDPAGVTDPASVQAPAVAITIRRARVFAEPRPDAAVVSTLGPGVALPLTSRSGTFVAILTPCQFDGWVDLADTRVEMPRPRVDQAAAFAQATFVLDAGHGGVPGAVGPGGTTEASVNMAIVRRLADLLGRPNDVDWTTGAIREGTSYGTPRVLLTRIGDYNAGLRYRTAVATAIGADALLSIHNNAEPDGPSERPGTEIFYQAASQASRRLAGLTYEEIVRALQVFTADWRAERDAGAKPRLNERGTDYYGLLRESGVPTVLIEALFISNRSEEELLRQPAVQQAIAEAIYRALVRFVTTQDPGTGYVDPYPRRGGPSGRLPSSCTDPA